MGTKFHNSGQVGILGENITNNGTAIGQDARVVVTVDWIGIRKEIEMLSASGVEDITIQSLTDAVEKEDVGLLRSCLNAGNVAKDFLVSLGASLLANILG